LRVQDANPHRERAWREAARSIRAAPAGVWELARGGGPPALRALPGIGPGIAAAIDEIVHTGRLGMLDHLEGEVTPEGAFLRLPGMGPALAARIHRELGISTLEELELAAHDGRLAAVRGFGERRIRAVRELLAAELGRRDGRRASGSVRPPPRALPAVEVLLDVDAEYRRRVAAGQLPRIAPRRFNPAGEPWLPVLHTERDGWSFTALYSNTARAHQLGRTHDWVVLYFERDGDQGQATVVTETRGGLAGRRVVRGREHECLRPIAPAA
jgi:hypothetical protein